VGVTGCGGGGDSGDALDNALGYVPADSPFVVTFSTDIEGEQAKSIQKIVERFPFSGQVQEQLEQGISQAGLDFEKDVKPALGNEFVVAALDAESFTSDDTDARVVGAIQAKDKEALERLLEKSETREIGEKDGAKLYSTSEDDVVAVEDDTFLVANSREDIEAAIERHDGDDKMTQGRLDQAVEGLPEDPLIRAFFNVKQLLDTDPDTADARKVEYVSALRDFGLTASFADDAINVDFRLGTEGDGLEETDLPFAAGDESPPVIEADGEIGFGLRDPAHIFRFGETAGQAIDPAGFGQYEAGKRTIERQLDVSIEDDVLAQLTGDVSATASIDGKFGARSALTDAPAFRRTLDRIARELPSIGGGALGSVTPPRGEGGLYSLTTQDGMRILFGVAEESFVVANDARKARSLSSTAEVEGAEGAVAMSADAQEVATTALRSFGGASGLGGALGGSLFTSPLGQLTGSMKSDTDAVTGNVRLTFD
jgi:Protein of unknown function (DUF3352)